jgi:DNA-binding HxlR family transcriptional regulator
VGTRIQGKVVIVETPKVYPEMPLRVEYKLTEKASRLRPILEQMVNSLRGFVQPTCSGIKGQEVSSRF